jgi:hypothetical protein
MVPRQSVHTDTIVLSTHHGVTTISHYWHYRAIPTPRCHDHQSQLIRSVIYMPWCHDYQSLLILPCYLHTMVPRRSVPTDTIVLSTHHGVRTISHYWHYRAIPTSRRHDHQSQLIRSCYLHAMVPRLSATIDTAVLSKYHGATTIIPY